MFHAPGPFGLIIIAAVVLVLFGRGKVAGLMGEIGKGIKVFLFTGIKVATQQLVYHALGLCQLVFVDNRPQRHFLDKCREQTAIPRITGPGGVDNINLARWHEKRRLPVVEVAALGV